MRGVGIHSHGMLRILEVQGARTMTTPVDNLPIVAAQVTRFLHQPGDVTTAGYCGHIWTFKYVEAPDPDTLTEDVYGHIFTRKHADHYHTLVVEAGTVVYWEPAPGVTPDPETVQELTVLIREGGFVKRGIEIWDGDREVKNAWASALIPGGHNSEEILRLVTAALSDG